MKELFLKNYEKLVAFVDAKNGLNESYNVYIYQMTTHANYALLKDKIQAVKTRLNNQDK